MLVASLAGDDQHRYEPVIRVVAPAAAQRVWAVARAIVARGEAAADGSGPADWDAVRGDLASATLP